MGMGSKGGGDEPVGEINVTPLVDVMLVLLIIFMVTAPMLEQGIDMNLPGTNATSLNKGKDERIVIDIYRDRSVSLDRKRMGVPAVKESVAKLLKAGTDKTVFVRADKDVPYGFVAYVLGEVKSSGAQKLSLVTVPLENAEL